LCAPNQAYPAGTGSSPPLIYHFRKLSLRATNSLQLVDLVAASPRYAVPFFSLVIELVRSRASGVVVAGMSFAVRQCVPPRRFE
jgi:hypothetical protein